MVPSAVVPSKPNPVTRSDNEENRQQKEKQNDMAPNKKTHKVSYIICSVFGRCLVVSDSRVSALLVFFFTNYFLLIDNVV